LDGKISPNIARFATQAPYGMQAVCFAG
jgi:hypothetical protein